MKMVRCNNKEILNGKLQGEWTLTTLMETKSLLENTIKDKKLANGFLSSSTKEVDYSDNQSLLLKLEKMPL
jgi:hypothetical protein